MEVKRLTVRIPGYLYDKIVERLTKQNEIFHMSKNSYIAALLKAALDGNTVVGPMKERKKEAQVGEPITSGRRQAQRKIAE